MEGLAVFTLFALVQLWQTRDALEGQAPPLTARLLNGDPYEIADNRFTLVYFWASWCPVCRLTSGNIDALAKQHSVITVAMQSGDAARVANHLKDQALDFPTIADPQGSIAREWGVKGVPTIYGVDKQGRIRFVSLGYTTSLGLKCRLWWAEHSDAIFQEYPSKPQ